MKFIITKEIVDNTDYLMSNGKPCYAQQAIINEGFSKKEANEIYWTKLVDLPSTCGNKEFVDDLIALDRLNNIKLLCISQDFITPDLPLVFEISDKYIYI